MKPRKRKQKRKTTPKNKYIDRMDYEKSRVHGWRVRYSPSVDWRQDVKSKCFSDKLHGGKRKALTAARAYRDKKLKEHNQSSFVNKDLVNMRTKVRHYHGTKRKNKSGVIGVTLDKQLKKGLYTCEAWRATTVINKKRTQRSFSTKRYGYNEAFKLACKARHDCVGTLIVTNRKMLPCDPCVPYEVVK